jgi:hypothetical protein
MKAALIMLITVLAASAAADIPSGPVRVAVLKLKADAAVDDYLGANESGSRLASLIANDLSVLAPIEVVASGEVARNLSLGAMEPSDSLTPSQARSAGDATGATNLVCGRIYRTDAGVVFAVKIVSTQTGEALGTMVQLGAGDTLSDALSRLGTQIGRIALSQRGIEAPCWADARIGGTHTGGGTLSLGAVACVLSVDSRLVADEIHNWNRDQILKPGLHEIFVRYYDGTGSAGHEFVIDAKPGGIYETRFDRDGDHNPRLWIQERGAKNPATPVYEATIKEPRQWYEDNLIRMQPHVVPMSSMFFQPAPSVPMKK